MEVTIYLPYYDYNDSSFDVNDNYYSSEEDYINAVSNEYNKSKDIVYNSMAMHKKGGSLIGVDGNMYKFGQSHYDSDDRISYSKCESVIFNDEGKEDDVDTIIEHFAKQESFVEMIELNLDTSEEEFESEISLWSREHNKINKYKNKLGEEWVWVNEPKRDIKLHFKNKANEDIYAVFENCKIMDKVDTNMYIVFVEKINLIDNI